MKSAALILVLYFMFGCSHDHREKAPPPAPAPTQLPPPTSEVAPQIRPADSVPNVSPRSKTPLPTGAEILRKLVVEEKPAELVTALEFYKLGGLDPRDDEGRIPLHYARSNEMANLLWAREVTFFSVERNKTVSKISALVADNEGRLPIHLIALENRTSALNVAFFNWCSWRSKKQLNAKDLKGRTIVHLAAINGDVDLMKFVLSCPYVDRAALDSDNRTALHLAAGHKDFAAGSVLWDTKAFDANQKDKFGESTLSLVNRNGNLEAERKLAR